MSEGKIVLKPNFFEPCSKYKNEQYITPEMLRDVIGQLTDALYDWANSIFIQTQGFLQVDGSVVGATGQAQDFGTNGITADLVSESTLANGVLIDGVRMKDNNIIMAKDGEITATTGAQKFSFNGDVSSMGFTGGRLGVGTTVPSVATALHIAQPSIAEGLYISGNATSIQLGDNIVKADTTYYAAMQLCTSAGYPHLSALAGDGLFSASGRLVFATNDEPFGQSDIRLIIAANGNASFSNDVNITGSLATANVIISDGGYIGSTSDTDAIQIEADGDVVFSQDVAISGTLGVTGIATLGDTSTLATSAAPTTDAMIANKKYVDDNGGVAAHAILDGSVHTDSAVDAVTRGSLIYGNATPKWDELVVSTGFLNGDGTDVAWKSYADTLAALSGQAGAAFDWNSQNLTSVGTIGCGAITSTADIDGVNHEASGHVEGTAGNGYLELRGDSGASNDVKLWDTGIMDIEGQSGCKAYQSAASQQVKTAEVVKVLFDAESFDVQNEFDNTVVVGTADGTVANHLQDDGASQFTAGMVGMEVWNTTDNTYATIATFNDVGDVTLDADIMANGEGYKIFASRFTATKAGKYFVAGLVNFNDPVVDASSLLCQIKKNGGGVALTYMGSSGTGRHSPLAFVYVDLSINDYIELSTYHTQGVTKGLANAEGYTNVNIMKVA